MQAGGDDHTEVEEQAIETTFKLITDLHQLKSLFNYTNIAK